MIGVVLLAGKNSRFFPLETPWHKAFNYLGGNPILYYTIQELKSAGVNEFVFVVKRNIKPIKKFFADGSDFGVKIHYTEQSDKPGQREAILSAYDELQGNDFFVVNPYHFLQKDIFKDVFSRFSHPDVDGIICGTYEKNISDYGAFELKGDKIVNYVEKPTVDQAPSHIRKTSVEVYESEFLKYLAEESPGEYASIDAMVNFIRDKNVNLYEIENERFIPSLKYAWDLLKLWRYITEDGSEHIKLDQDKNYIHKSAQVLADTKISHSNIEKNVQIGSSCIIKNTLVLEGAKIGDNCIIKDSIIGKGVHIGEKVIIDRTPKESTIKLRVKKRMVDTGLKKLGAIIGEQSFINDSVKIDRGILIGAYNKIETNLENSQVIPHNNSN